MHLKLSNAWQNRRRAMSTGVALAAVVVCATTTSAHAQSPTAGSTPTRPDLTAPLSGVTAQQPSATGRYVVTLKTEPVATYQGGVAGIPGTKPAPGEKVSAVATNTVNLRTYLLDQQRQVAASVGVEATQNYTVALNGFAATLTPAQLAAVKKRPEVAAVVPDSYRQVQNDQVDYDALKLAGRNGVWNQLGGAAHAGAGIVIGVVDTGIWPESASFAAPALTTGYDPKHPNRAYRDGNTIVVRKANGSQFTGTCQTGQRFTAAACNTKLVGARFFNQGFLSYPGTLSSTEFDSPRDSLGHGTHTASEAAGNYGVDAVVNGRSYGKISGMAPGADIAVYKALWSGTIGGQEVSGGGLTSDLVSAIDAATVDGVDVLNYSVGGGEESPANDPVQLAFLSAASAGIFISASAGNAGPDPSTLDNAQPWTTTAAASTLAPYYGSVTLGDGKVFTGASNSVVRPVGPKPLVYAGNVAITGADPIQAQLCYPGLLNPTKVKGRIVVCDRGVIARTDKSFEVKRAGGVGMILTNTADQDTDADIHAVPTVHLNVPAADTVRAYAGTTGATATLAPGNLAHVTTVYPQVAAFSSRGPSTTSNGDLLKPDIAAPGVAILAAYSPTTSNGHNFEFESGTSMAAPHIAGLGALTLAAHPTLSPAEIKSALMTTAGPTYNTDGTTSTDWTAQGAGQVTPAKMLNPGLVYNAGDSDWLAYLEGLGVATGTGATAKPAWDYNGPSFASGRIIGTRTFTRTVTATTPGIYRATAVVPGMTAIVSPSILPFAKVGDTATFKLTLTQTTAASGTVNNGSLTWTGNNITVKSPISVTAYAADTPADVHGTGTAGRIAFAATAGAPSQPITAFGLTSSNPTTVTGDGDAPHGALKAIPFTVTATTKVVDVLATPTERTNAPCISLLYGTPDPDQYYGDDAIKFFVDGVPTCAASGDSANVTKTTLKPGVYTALIQSFGNAPGTTSNTTEVQLNEVDSGGTLQVTPTVGPRFAGLPFTVRASWTDAPANRRSVGYVQIGQDVGTVVKIDN